jgi:molecular chaperone IbpA
MKEIILTSQYISEIFNNVASRMIGFDPIFRELDQIRNLPARTNFPPYNIVKINENKFTISLALAGYKKDEINISLSEHRLIIEGNSKDKADENLIYNGIANRNFRQVFALAEHVEVLSAEYEDGILKIDLENIVPESKKPKNIKIN